MNFQYNYKLFFAKSNGIIVIIKLSLNYENTILSTIH
jgi:hypothetical protein